jgi:hypothetical protein
MGKGLPSYRALMSIFTKGYPVVDFVGEEPHSVGPLDHTLVAAGKRSQVLEECADRLDPTGSSSSHTRSGDSFEMAGDTRCREVLRESAPRRPA